MPYGLYHNLKINRWLIIDTQFQKLWMAHVQLINEECDVLPTHEKLRKFIESYICRYVHEIYARKEPDLSHIAYVILDNLRKKKPIYFNT